MKSTYSIISTVLIACCTLFAQAENTSTVKEQLNNLNSHWKDKKFNDPILKERIPLNDDVSLIQMHLSLVEKKLREENSATLTEEQSANRNGCLDILHSYFERGIFPKNLYHKK